MLLWDQKPLKSKHIKSTEFQQALTKLFTAVIWKETPPTKHLAPNDLVTVTFDLSLTFNVDEYLQRLQTHYKSLSLCTKLLQ